MLKIFINKCLQNSPELSSKLLVSFPQNLKIELQKKNKVVAEKRKSEKILQRWRLNKIIRSNFTQKVKQIIKPQEQTSHVSAV